MEHVVEIGPPEHVGGVRLYCTECMWFHDVLWSRRLPWATVTKEIERAAAKHLAAPTPQES